MLVASLSPIKIKACVPIVEHYAKRLCYIFGERNGAPIDVVLKKDFKDVIKVVQQI